MDSKPLISGEIVASRYRATRLIASGGMGQVWEGVHVRLGHRVAMKVLRQEAHGHEEIEKRFRREGTLLARIVSDHVVRVIDFIERGDHGPVLVMEMIEGESLAQVLQRECVPIERAIDIAIDVLRGLVAIHKQCVIHRDIKPGNIMLRKMDDGRTRAVIVDLGVARFAHDMSDDGEFTIPTNDEEVTTADRIVGTAEYMAPEQIVSCRTAAPAVDVYSVGAVLYRAILGRHSYGDVHGIDLVRQKISNPAPPMQTERTDALAKEFASVVTRSMAHMPEGRFESAQHFIDALSNLRAPKPAPPPPPIRRNRRPWRVFTLATAALLVVLAAWSASTDSQASSGPPQVVIQK